MERKVRVTYNEDSHIIELRKSNRKLKLAMKQANLILFAVSLLSQPRLTKNDTGEHADEDTHAPCTGAIGTTDTDSSERTVGNLSTLKPVAPNFANLYLAVADQLRQAVDTAPDIETLAAIHFI